MTGDNDRNSVGGIQILVATGKIEHKFYIMDREGNNGETKITW